MSTPIVNKRPYSLWLVVIGAIVLVIGSAVLVRTFWPCSCPHLGVHFLQLYEPEATVRALAPRDTTHALPGDSIVFENYTADQTTFELSVEDNLLPVFEQGAGVTLSGGKQTVTVDAFSRREVKISTSAPTGKRSLVIEPALSGLPGPAIDIDG